MINLSCTESKAFEKLKELLQCNGFVLILAGNIQTKMDSH